MSIAILLEIWNIFKCRMSCVAVGENPTYENLNLQNKVEIVVNEDSFYESIHFRVSIM